MSLKLSAVIILLYPQGLILGFVRVNLDFLRILNERPYKLSAGIILQLSPEIISRDYSSDLSKWILS
jgi:hypothetical protein